MKNAKMFSFVRLSENSMVASVRIAYWLAKRLSVPLTWQADIADKMLDTLIIVNGAYGFCKYLEPLAEAVLSARRVVWVQNDYTIIPPRTDGDAQSPFRRAFVERAKLGRSRTIFWSTCEKWFSQPGSSRVNWNMLTFDENYDPGAVSVRRTDASDTLFYYGSWREASGKSNRVPLFRRYFQNPTIRTVISSPVDKFAKAFPLCQHTGPISSDFYEVLGSHGMGLYIEDRKSSEEFHSPANRFYEMLSAGLPMVFMPESGSMLRRENIDPTPYAARNTLEIERMFDRREKIGAEQRERWIPSRSYFRDELIRQVDAAVGRLK